MYTIQQGSDKEPFFLNHAYLSSKAFGSEDMAWTTTDHEEATNMLKAVKKHHKGSYKRFKIVSI